MHEKNDRVLTLARTDRGLPMPEQACGEEALIDVCASVGSEQAFDPGIESLAEERAGEL